MESELINLDKIKEIFSNATGERTIEVTQIEFQQILKEITQKGLPIIKTADSLTVKLKDLTIKITFDPDEEEDET